MKKQPSFPSYKCSPDDWISNMQNLEVTNLNEGRIRACEVMSLALDPTTSVYQ